MAVSVEIGYESSLYVNTGTYASPTWTEISLARDVTANKAVDQVDVTTRLTARNGFRANDYGLRTLGWSFDMLVPAAGESDTAYDALVDAQNDRTSVDILHVEGGLVSVDGLKATRAVCGVFGGEKGEPLADASTSSFELSFILNDDQDVPQFGTTSGGEFGQPARHRGHDRRAGRRSVEGIQHRGRLQEVRHCEVRV